MRNTVKMIKTISIVTLFAILAACSSGGSGTTEGLNLTGTFQGTIQETTEVAFDVLLNITQDNTVGLTGGADTSNITFSITILSTSNPAFPPCIGTLAGETATITFNSDNPILAGDGFSAFANNNEINGQIVIEGDDFNCGGPLSVFRV